MTFFFSFFLFFFFCCLGSLYLTSHTVVVDIEGTGDCFRNVSLSFKTRVECAVYASNQGSKIFFKKIQKVPNTKTLICCNGKNLPSIYTVSGIISHLEMI